jgi:hypothetical protein
MGLYSYTDQQPIRHSDFSGLDWGQTTCNPPSAPGDLLVCGDTQTTFECELVPPGKCSTIGDGELIYVPGGGWYKCDAILEDCDPDWWVTPLDNDLGDDAITPWKPGIGNVPRWRPGISEGEVLIGCDSVCTTFASDRSMNSWCSSYLQCMNDCLMTKQSPGNQSLVPPCLASE